MTTESVLSEITKKLSSLKLMPLKLDYADIGKIRMVNVYDTIDSDIITDSICTGMDLDLATASLKALVERIERSAFQFGHDNKDTSCMTERSDGFAAYPMNMAESEGAVRTNALNEAIERYVWANWWDNSQFTYSVETPSHDDQKFWSNSYDFIKELQTIIEFGAFRIVRPEIANQPDKEVIIIFAELLPYGVISGGACGYKNEASKTIFRAMSELFRHGHALSKIKSKNLQPQTFYEKRLKFFGTAQGFSIYQNRLLQNGDEKIVLPKLKIDNRIAHPMSEAVLVHRCLFENQPPFVGGNLERLCL